MIQVKRMLRNCVIAAVMLVFTGKTEAQTGSYIANHRAIANLLSYTYGIPSQLILAVATVESSGGRGPAAKVLNNHFGIEGRNYLASSKGFKSRYKQYPNALASYLDFCLLLTHKQFYYKLKNRMDCVAWVKAMSRAHYSEVPQEWEQKIFTVLSILQKQGTRETVTHLAKN